MTASPPLAIVQARMNSSRLPGKVLASMAGRPMLAHLLERLRECRAIGGIVLATSTEPGDDPLAAFCADAGVACHRGPLDDVAGRFLAVLDATRAEAFVRINGDSPLLVPDIVDQAVALFAAGTWDLATNVQRRSFPKGQSVEVVRTASFRWACRDLMESREDREHVTRCFYGNPDRFRIVNFSSGRDMAAIQLSVDTAEDFAAAAAILGAGAHPRIGLDDLMAVRARARGVRPAIEETVP